MTLRSLKREWFMCPDCGARRLLQIRNKKVSLIKRCGKCSKTGIHNSRWRGGRNRRVGDGYTQIRLYPNNPFYSMCNKEGYVLEHRLVMAEHLSRCLFRWEIVHHRNGVRDDNRLGNLELVSPTLNKSFEILCGNCELKKSIRLLQWQIKELTKQLQVKLGIE